MRVGFVLLAFSTAFDITADKGSEAWPPELCSNQLVSFQETRVAGRFVIMATLKYGASQ